MADFDKIRVILEPMQDLSVKAPCGGAPFCWTGCWIEFVMDRVDQFSDLLQRRLRGKRNAVVKNFRKMVKPDSKSPREKARLHQRLCQSSQSYT